MLQYFPDQNMDRSTLIPQNTYLKSKELRDEKFQKTSSRKCPFFYWFYYILFLKPHKLYIFYEVSIFRRICKLLFGAQGWFPTYPLLREGRYPGSNPGGAALAQRRINWAKKLMDTKESLLTVIKPCRVSTV